MARFDEASYFKNLEDARRNSYRYKNAEERARHDAENGAAWEAEARLYDLNQEPKHDDLRAIERAFPTRVPMVRQRLRLRFTSEAAWLAWLELADYERRFHRLLNTPPEEEPQPQPETPKDPLELERETERQTGKTTARVLVADYGIPKSTLGDLLRKWRDAPDISLSTSEPREMNRAEVATARALLELERQKRDARKPGF